MNIITYRHSSWWWWDWKQVNIVAQFGSQWVNVAVKVYIPCEFKRTGDYLSIQNFSRTAENFFFYFQEQNLMRKQGKKNIWKLRAECIHFFFFFERKSFLFWKKDILFKINKINFRASHSLWIKLKSHVLFVAYFVYEFIPDCENIMN